MCAPPVGLGRVVPTYQNGCVLTDGAISSRLKGWIKSRPNPGVTRRTLSSIVNCCSLARLVMSS